MRIEPKDIAKLEERFSELKERVGDKEYKDNLANGSALEKIMSESTNADINSFQDSQIKAKLDKLLNRNV